MEKHSTSVNADGKDQKHWALVRENAKNAKIFLKDFTAYVECPKGIANVNEWFASNSNCLFVCLFVSSFHCSL